MTNATFLGHPRGLATLFFTEMFERLTFYGMRALLVLFLTASANEGGLGLAAGTAGAIYGLYTGSVYLASMPGGWIADRLLGQRLAVLIGGSLISLGNFILAIPATPAVFYSGLAVIVFGVGLLKPNISAMVGRLYEGQAGARRDAGFSIFYMGINVGAFVAPFVVGTVGETIGYHWGFLCSGVATAMGVVQYRLTSHYLGEAGARPTHADAASRTRDWRIVGIGLAVLALAVGLLASGALGLSITQLAAGLGGAMLVLAILFFGAVLAFGGLTNVERGRVLVIALFFAVVTLFWAGYEQAATTFNLFARDYTDRSFLGSWFEDGRHPVSWYQSTQAIAVIVLSPVFAWLWVSLARRNLDPSAPAKFGLSMVLMAVGFLVMVVAAKLVASSGGKVLPGWLLTLYVLQTAGELCISPVGLSNVTKLSPPRYVGQMMGTWFLGAALGNVIAGLIGGEIGAGTAAEMPHEFWRMGLFSGAVALAVLLTSPFFKRLMGGVR
jgi:POT family proton-dependent oligopeptide transporter